MSDTPETDAELAQWLRDNSSGIYRPAAVAADRMEELERERDEARKIAETLNINVTKGPQYIRFPWEGADNE
jgi:hypothetical protein